LRRFFQLRGLYRVCVDELSNGSAVDSTIEVQDNNRMRAGPTSASAGEPRFGMPTSADLRRHVADASYQFLGTLILILPARLRAEPGEPGC
jgi:hypothetical protein